MVSHTQRSGYSDWRIAFGYDASILHADIITDAQCQILEIVLFIFFAAMSVTRAIMYPALTKRIYLDFSQTSYLGAIPVSIDTILVPLSHFYADRRAAIWAAWGLWWIAMLMSVAVGVLIVFIICAYQDPHDLSTITGV